MRRLAADPQRGRAMGEVAKATIVDGFSAQAVGERIEQRLTQMRQT